MTVEVLDIAAKVAYTIADLTPGDEYNIPFKYLGNDEYIKVFVRDSSGTVQNLVLDVDYDVTNSDGNNNVWGVITILSKRSGLQSICIYRDVEISQDVVFDSQSVSPDTMEQCLDKQTMIIQDNLSPYRYVRATLDSEIDADSLEFSVDDAVGKFLYLTYDKKIVGKTPAVASMALRQSADEVPNPTFELSYDERRNTFIAFDDNADVNLQSMYSAGTGIGIDENNVISQTPATKNRLGGIIPGQHLTVTAGGVVSVDVNFDSAVVDDLTTEASGKALSAKQGVKLNKNKVAKYVVDIAGNSGKNVKYHPDGLQLRNLTRGPVYVASSGTSILQSSDLDVWEYCDHPSITGVENILYGNSVYIADCQAITLKSIDGIVWTDVGHSFNEIVFARNLFFGTLNNELYVSTDGEKWDLVLTIDFGDSVCGVCYENGKFLALSTRGSLCSSENGLDWAQIPFIDALAPGSFCVNIISGNGVYIAERSDEIIYVSPDGFTWREVSEIEDLGYGGIIKFARMGQVEDSYFGVASGGYFYCSVKGDNWKKIEGPSDIADFGVCDEQLIFYRSDNGIDFIGNTYYVVDALDSESVEYPLSANQGRVLSEKITSESGAIRGELARASEEIAHELDELRAETSASNSLKLDKYLFNVAPTSGTNIATGVLRSYTIKNGSLFLVGYDGKIYKVNQNYGLERTYTVSGEEDLKQIRDCNGSFAICGTNNSIYIADYNFSSIEKQNTQDMAVSVTDITYKDNKYIATAEAHIILIGENGTWTSIDTGHPSSWYSITQSDDMLWVAGSGGRIIKGSDGRTWTDVNSGTDKHLYKIFNTGRFFLAGGESGTLLYSADGDVWENIINPLTSSPDNTGGEALFDFAMCDGFILCSGARGVMWSVDGKKWHLIEDISNYLFWSTVWNGDLVCGGLTNGTVYHKLVSVEGMLKKALS